MKKNKHKFAGFTLIELLVVISIIAVLMSILMPSLARAREQAKRVVGSSNIRQLHLSNSAYSTENDGRFVLAAQDILGPNLHRWHGVRDNVNEPFDTSRSPLANYLGDGMIKECPSFKQVFRQSGQVNAGFEAGCGGYGYNAWFIGGRYDLYSDMFEAQRHSAKNTQIKKPAATVMFTDSAYRQVIDGAQAGFIEYSFCETPKRQYGSFVANTGNRPNPTIHFRHFGSTVVIWADGHVGYEKMSFSSDYKTHAIMDETQTAQMQLGWFGPDSNELFDLK